MVQPRPTEDGPTEQATAPDVTLEAAQGALDDGRPGDAEEICRNLLEDDDADHAGVRAILAQALEQLGRVDEAHREYLLAARGALDDRRYEDAEEICRNVLASDADLAEAHTVLGFALEDMDRVDEARREYLVALELGGTAEPAYALIESLLSEGEITEPNRRTIAYAEWQPAVERQSASFGQVFAALYGSGELAPNSLEAAHARFYYPELSKAFQKAHGRVTNRFFANDVAAGTALTADDQLHLAVFWNGFYFDTRVARASLRRITDLRDEAQAYLLGDRHKVFLEKLYTAMTELIVSLQSEWARHRGHDEEPVPLDPPSDEHLAVLAELDKRLDALAEELTLAARHQAQALYSVGTVIGAAALAVTVLACVIAGVQGVGLGVTLAGAAGSFVSVALRLTNQTPFVDYTAGRRSVVFFGVLRPLVGCVFGWAVYALVGGGLASYIQIPDDADVRALFFSSLAFVAGFSERFAQDVIVQTTGIANRGESDQAGRAPASG